MTNNTHTGDEVTALFPLEENTDCPTNEEVDALFHDDSDAEGNPGFSVWDSSPTPRTPSTRSKKAAKRKYDAIAEQHDDALPSSSPLATPISNTSSHVESKAVDTAPTSPVASPGSEQRKSEAPKMSNAPPRYEPVKKRARKADGAGKSKGNTEPKQEPKTESKTASKPTTTPKKPKITQRRVAKDPHRPLPPPLATSTAANDALSDDDPAKLWCHCRTPIADRNMILCDDKECGVGWYHMNCVKVKGEPAKWFCAACKSKSGGGVKGVSGPAPWGKTKWAKKNGKGRK